MAFFIPPAVVAGVSALASWYARRKLAATAAAVGGAMLVDRAADVVLTPEEHSGMMERVNIVVVNLAREYAGLELDPAAPLTDGSIAAAVSAIAGIRLRSVRNRQIMAEDLAAVVSQMIAERTGLVLRNPLDKQMVIEDVEGYAAARLTDRTGIKITSLRDPQKIKSDITAYAIAEIGNRYGIPIPDASSPEAVVAALKDWGRAEGMALMVDDVEAALARKDKTGLTLGARIIERTSKLKPGGASRAEVLAVANTQAAAAIEGAKKIRDMRPAAVRRREQNRQAQRKFRGRHQEKSQWYDPARVGGYMHYVRVGGGKKPAGGAGDIQARARFDTPASWYLGSDPMSSQTVDIGGGWIASGGPTAASTPPPGLVIPAPADKARIGRVDGTPPPANTGTVGAVGPAQPAGVKTKAGNIFGVKRLPPGLKP